MTLDLNDAGPQKTFDLIPAGTIATVQMVIRAGGVGEDGWLKRSANGGSEGLDCEFIVIDGEYAKRKIWQFMLLNGTTDGHAKAAEISRALLRGILESARNIKPSDVSEEAAAKRKAEIADFVNLRFIARISIEKSKDPQYPDKNRLEAITPDQRQWVAVEQIATEGQAKLSGMTEPTATAKPTQPVNRPAWAQG
jgi:hypothetical protein